MWSNTLNPEARPFNFQGQQQPVQSPYPNSPLLTEIHTNFPALLYDSGRFTTLTSVFNYVDRRMHDQYNVYSNARRQYREERRSSDSEQQQQQHESNPTDLNTIAYLMSAVSQLNLQIQQDNPVRFQGWDDPVPVRPTPHQLQRSTTVGQAAATSDTPCAICQDTITQGDPIRNITACNHTFHRLCIDTWIVSNVHCPVCRHDIRNQYRAAGGPTGPLPVPPRPPTGPSGPSGPTGHTLPMGVTGAVSASMQPPATPMQPPV